MRQAAWGLLALALTSCSATGGGTLGPPPSPVPSTGGPASHSSAARDASHEVDKLLVFVVENRSRDQMLEGLPTVAALGEEYGLTTDYRGIAHPSLPNYLVMAGGSTFGVTDDDSPAAHTAAGPSVFGAAIAAGGTARLYAEGMPAPCHTEPEGRYAVKHNPWAYFEDERSACAVDDVDMGTFDEDVRTGQLPAVGMVIPDLCNDAHDCDVSVADDWLRQRLATVMSGPDWAGGHLAVVVTADEDDGSHDQLVLTVIAHPSLHHVTVDEPLDHYGLSRAYAEVAGIAPLGDAGGAESLLQAFGLVPGTTP